MQVAASASREAMAAVAAHRGERPSRLGWVVRPWTMAPLLGLAPRFVPFDLEAYLRYHFTKVGDQTRAMVDTYVQIARRHGLGTSALEALARQAEAAAQRPA
jgi:2-dehydropantoate 2-reductase